MIDFTGHNEEVRQVWAAYHQGQPIRVPMLLTSVQRIWVQDPALNRHRFTWQDYLTRPEVMYEVSLQHRYHVAHHIPQDAEMGIPAKQWDISIEFGNVYEEAWLGCEIVYPEGQIATTRPRYQAAARNDLFQRGLPGPFDGFMGKLLADFEYCRDRAGREEFHGRPLHILNPAALGTDGPLTVANGICGVQILEDMLSDEKGYHAVMDFITEAIIGRIRAWRAYFHLDPRPTCWGFADDAIQFLSVKTYREKVLPYHKRLLSALAGDGPHGMHLCGNVQRFFPTLVQELNINSFDTGYPIRFETLRDEVGEGVEIQGGVPVADLLNRTPEEITQRTRSILQSGILRGGRFILKEANDLPPCVPLQNMEAMYTAARMYGIYRRD